MRLLSILCATIMAIATAIFHYLYRSTLLFALWRVAVTWIGFLALILIVNYFWELVIGPQSLPVIENTQGRRTLELISRPEDDDYFR